MFLQCLILLCIQISRERERENPTVGACGLACTSSSTRFERSVIMMSSKLLQYTSFSKIDGSDRAHVNENVCCCKESELSCCVQLSSIPKSKNCIAYVTRKKKYLLYLQLICKNIFFLGECGNNAANEWLTQVPPNTTEYGSVNFQTVEVKV